MMTDDAAATIVFMVDGDGPFSLAEMVDGNCDDQDLIDRLRDMRDGDVLVDGGGAWAETRIEAVERPRQDMP